MTVHARCVSTDELSALTQLARSRTRGAGLVRRAQIVLYGVEGLGAPDIAIRMGLSRKCVRFWLKRFNDQGLGGLHEAVRSGRPPTYTAAPTGSAVICLDEMGPQACKSYPGQRLVAPVGPKAERARQEIDYDRRDRAGYVFGALQPVTGAAFTATYLGRTTANWLDFLGRVEAWIDPAVERVYAVLDNLTTHTALDVLLFNLAHPRWEFVFQPKYAAYLNLIEPWWKVLRSLALKGHRFDA